MELRYLEKRIPHPSNPELQIKVTVLQRLVLVDQKRGFGAMEWQDVPTVKENQTNNPKE